jgi:hypothetical protein
MIFSRDFKNCPPVPEQNPDRINEFKSWIINMSRFCTTTIQLNNLNISIFKIVQGCTPEIKSSEIKCLNAFSYEIEG